MLIEGAHTNPNPRMDGGPKGMQPENMIGEIEYFPESESFMLRIADRGNVEFHLEIHVTMDELTNAANQAEKGQQHA